MYIVSDEVEYTAVVSRGLHTPPRVSSITNHQTGLDKHQNPKISATSRNRSYPAFTSQKSAKRCELFALSILSNKLGLAYQMTPNVGRDNSPSASAQTHSRLIVLLCIITPTKYSPKPCVMLITLRPSDFYVPDRSMQLRVGLSIDRYEIKCASQPIEIGGCWPRKVTSSVSWESSMHCILDRSGCL